MVARLTADPNADPASVRRAAIVAVRAMHGLITAFFVSCLSIIYAGITRRRRGLALAASAAGNVLLLALRRPARPGAG